MPPTSTAKGDGAQEMQRAAPSRRAQRGGRQRGREEVPSAPPPPPSELDGVGPTANPASSTSDSQAAPEQNSRYPGSTSGSTVSITPAALVLEHEAHSTTSSSSVDGGDEEASDATGLVRPLTVAAFSASDAAASANDEETAARLLQQSRGAAQSIHAQVESCVSRFKVMETQLDTLLKERQEVRPKVEEIAQSRHIERFTDVVALNVGGERFTVPLATLLGKDEPNYFHVLLGSQETSWVAPVFKDESNTIFIDRDPVCFRYVLDYLRDYRYLNLLTEDLVRRLKVDAAYYRLPGLLSILGDMDCDTELQFSPGPGVNPERNRLRVVYGVSVVGDVSLVTGRHTITYEVKVADYVGFGLISESCVNTDQEFHKIPDCCVYYMSGVFYTNYPYHRKEENLERIESGDFVTVKVDLDKGYVEYVLKNARKMVSLGRARRLRFATTMKLASRVRIVPSEEVRRRLPPVHYSFEE